MGHIRNWHGTDINLRAEINAAAERFEVSPDFDRVRRSLAAEIRDAFNIADAEQIHIMASGPINATVAKPSEVDADWLRDAVTRIVSEF